MNIRKHTIILSAFFALALLCSNTAFAQGSKTRFIDPREADEHFSHHNYIAAMKVYKELIKRDPGDMEYTYKLAQCYLNTNFDKTQAIQYLEKVVKAEKVETEALYDMGTAYQLGNRFDDAIKFFTKYKEKGGKKDKAERAIETCYNGKELIKFPLNVTFENLGKDINSEYADYYPFSTKNESFMVFTSRRKGGKSNAIESDGLIASDIWMTTVKDGNWVKALNIGIPVNSTYDEQAVGLSPDGTSMTVYMDHIDSAGNIYISNFDKGKFKKMVKLNEGVNAGFESSGSVSDDGRIIFFSSERSGGSGGLDLYMSKKLPTGDWATPQSLGKKINTIYNEDFPHFAEDGKTLYFCSQGHSSMGGYDIFKAEYDNETNTWSEPKNLGYPVNTTFDNYTISFTEKNRAAYVSSWREGGMGDLDIYRIRFNDTEQRNTLFHCYMSLSDSSKLQISDVSVTLKDPTQDDDKIYTPNPASGRFVMILAPGKYTLNIEGKGFTKYSETFIVLDKGSFQPELVKKIVLTKSP